MDHRGTDDVDVRSVAYLVGGMACFGTATPVSAIVGRSFPAFLGSFGRMAVAAAVLVPIHAMAVRRRDERPAGETAAGLGRADWARLVVIAAVGTFGFSILMLSGMRLAPGAVASVVMATTPAVTAVGAVAFLGDRLGRWRLLGLALAVGGVVVVNLGADITDGTGDEVVLGAALVFAAVCCEATYSLTGKRLSADLSPLQIVTAAAVLASVLFLPFAIRDIRSFGVGEPTVGEWIALGWWGAGTMALGSWLWFRGMRRVAAGTAAAFMAVMPVSALIGSYVLLGEAVEVVHFVGMAISLAGLAAVIRSGAAVH